MRPPTTQKAVKAFQQEFGIEAPVPGDIGPDDAQRMNEVGLQREVFFVCTGTVTAADGATAPDVDLELGDVDNSEPCARTRSDAGGRYLAYYDPRFYAHEGGEMRRRKDRPDLVLRAPGPDGIDRAQSEAVRGDRREVRIDLRLAAEPFPEPRREDAFSVSGVVVDADGRPVPGIAVVVLDRDVGRDHEPLGQRDLPVVTDAEGRFSIPYAASDFRQREGRSAFAQRADLLFDLKQGERPAGAFGVVRLPVDGDASVADELPVTDEEMTLGIVARPHEQVRIILGDVSAPRGPTLFERLVEALVSLSTRVPLADFDEAANGDVRFAARESGLERDDVADVVDAHRLARDCEAAPALTFAAVRGLGARDARAVAAQAPAALARAFTEAVAAGLVPPLADGDVDGATARLRDAAARRAMAAPLQAGVSFDASLRDAIPDPAVRADLFARAAGGGLDDAAWARLAADRPGLDVAGARFALQTAALAGGAPGLAERLRAAVPGATSLRTLALNLDGVALADAVAAARPAPRPGEDADAAARRTADEVAGVMAVTQTTAVVARDVAVVARFAPESVPRTTADLLARAVQTTTFDLARDRVAGLVSAHGETLFEGVNDASARAEAVEGLARVQRLFRISPDPVTLKAALSLRGADGSPFRAALDIARLSEAAFVARAAGATADEVEGLRALHRRAVGQAETVSTLLVSYHQERSDAAPALSIPGKPLDAEGTGEAPAAPAAGPAPAPAAAPAEPRPDTIASLQELIGGSDMCECDDCRSVMGPAAYLVDLFEFLDKRCTPDGAGVTLLDVLIGNEEKGIKGRRSDLAHIKLSCENTNTTIPTIDLINEILESIVAQDNPPTGFDLKGKPLESSFGATGAQLSAAPENVQEEAYRILAGAVYPMSLPFDRLLATARAALELAEVSRAEMLDLFATGEAARTALRAERLGLFARDVEILTGKSLDGSPAADPAGTDALFGREGADWMTDLPKVRNLLHVLDISYADLVSLLRTRFVGGEVPDLEERDIRARIYLTVDELQTVRQPGYVDGSDARISEALALGQVKLDEVRALFEAPSRRDRIDQIWVLDPPIGCDLEGLQVRTLSAGQLDGKDPATYAQTEAGWRRVNLFVRLARRMGLPFDELDVAINALGLPGDEGFSLDQIEALGDLAELRRVCDVDWPVAAALAGDISTHGAASLYARLFLATGISRLHASFAPDADGMPFTAGAALETGVQGIAAALGQPPATIRALAAALGLATLTAASVSALHRICVLAGVLGIAPLDLVGLAGDLGGPDLAKRVAPSALLAFMSRARVIIEAVGEPGAVGAFVREMPDGWDPAAVRKAIADALVAPMAADAAERAAAAAATAPDTPVLDDSAGENARLVRRRGAALAAATAALGGSPVTLTVLLGGADDPSKALLTIADKPALDVIAAGQDGSAALLMAWRALRILDALGWDPATTVLAMGDMDLLSLAHLRRNAAGRAAVLEEVAIAQACLKATGRPVTLASACAALRKSGGVIDAITAAAVGRWLSMPASVVFDAGAAASGALEPSRAAKSPFAALALLKTRVDAARKLGLSSSQCATLVAEPLAAATLDVLMQGLKSRFSASGWLEASRRMFDPIRQASRDALVAHLVRKKGLRDADQLFGLYFVDIQTNAFVLTSRIRQAIFAVHIFAQRIQMGNEIKNGVLPSQFNTKEWLITGRYPTWASRVQALLYPENLLEPGWRDDKTPGFKAFENALRQSDATAAAALQAYTDLFDSLHVVASLEVCGTFLQTVFEGDEAGMFVSVLHVVGRSRGGVTRKYFYRRLNRYEHHQEWTPWSPVTADIQGIERDRLSPRPSNGSGSELFEAGVHVLPIVHEGRLHLFWPTLVRKVDQPNSPPINAQKEITPRFASPYWEVKLCWSQLQGDLWTPKQQSAALYESWWNETGITASGGSMGTAFVMSAMKLKAIFGAYVRAEPQYPNPADLVLKASGSGDGAAIVLGLRRPRSGGTSQRVEALTRFSLPTRTRDTIVSDQGGFVDGDHVALSASALSGSYMGLAPTGAVKATPPGQARDGDRLFDAPAGARIVTLNQGFGAPLLAPLFLSAVGRSYMAVPAHGTTMVPVEAPAGGKDYLPWTTEITGGFSRAALAAAQAPQAAPSHPWLATATTSMRVASASLIETTPASAAVGRDQGIAISRAAAVPSDFLEGIAKVGRRSMAVDAVNLTVEPFWHAHMDVFARTFRTGGVDALLAPAMQTRSLGAPASFMSVFAADPNRVTGPTDESVAFDASSAYGVYNWEIFFHGPMLVMKRLWDNGRLDEALEWFHLVLNPLDYGDDVANAWRFTPLRQVDMTPIDQLLTALSRPDGDPQKTAMLAQVQVVRLFPFQAHRLARLRPGAYRRWAVMQYILLRVALGDRFFRRFTPEDVNLSIQQFMIAKGVAGRRAQTMMARTTLPSMTYAQLRPRLNGFSNVAYEAETLLGPTAGATPAATTDVALGVVRRASIQYFGVPKNQKLMALWDLVEDRLYKIRNGMNIDGQQIQLPLFSPPIDPALLAEAAAGGNLADVLAGLNEPPPRRRFRAVHREAMALAEAVVRLGASLSESRDRRDTEDLAHKRAENEKELADLILQTRQAQLDEATRAVESAGAERQAPLERWQHYRDLLGAHDLIEPTLTPKPEDSGKAERYMLQRTLNLVQAKDMQVGTLSVLSVAPILIGAAFGGLGGAAAAGAAASLGVAGGAGTTTGSAAGIISGGTILSEEAGEIEESFKAADKAAEASNIEILGSILQIIPNIEAAAKPLGAGVGVSFGGHQLGGVQTALSREKQAIGAMHSFFAGLLGKQASYVLREREWAAQLHQAAADIKRAEQSAAVALLRKGAAERELAAQTAAARHAEQVRTYLKQKFTRVDLFDYRISQQMELFRRAFDLALERALMAQASFGYEREPRNFVRVARPADARGELTSGHDLLACLADMERAFVEPPEHGEITRQISLRQIAPEALWTLRETGECRFTVPEALFDIDHPGHYDRRLRSMQVTIPYLQTPGAPLTGELVMEEAFRRKVAPVEGMPDIASDGVTQAPWIALSTMREDAGRFELTGQSDDYNPFEGRGAVARFALRFPTTLRRVNYRAVSDVILTCRYVSTPGGQAARQAVEKRIQALYANLRSLADAPSGAPCVLLSLKHDLPDVWDAYQKAPDAPIQLQNLDHALPYLFRRSMKTKLVEAQFSELLKDGSPAKEWAKGPDGPPSYKPGAAAKDLDDIAVLAVFSAS